MRHQLLEWDVVVDVLRLAGVPDALGQEIVAILTAARFDPRGSLGDIGFNNHKAFIPVDKLEPRLIAQVCVEESCSEWRGRQDGYRSARLAVLLCTVLGVGNV